MRPGGTFDTRYTQDMAILRTRFQWVMFILFLMFLFGLFPLLAGDQWLSVVSMIGIVIIAAIGLNILTGCCGQISLGHAAFVGLGAYISGSLSHYFGWSFWVALPCAALGTSLMGLLVGLPALRIKGFYIAVSTVAAHFIIMWIIIHARSVTGGVEGLSVPLVSLGSIVFDTERKSYFLIMGFTVLFAMLARNLVRTRVGRAFIAIRDNDIAAEFMGINVFRYKILAFATCSAYAGIAGSLLAHYVGIITPQYFTFVDSIWYLGYIIVGGMGSITGAIFGVISLKLLGHMAMFAGPQMSQFIPVLAGTTAAGLMRVLFGVVIILFLVFEPRGLYHRWQVIKTSLQVWPFPY